jgi:hypothetical protein
MVMLESLEISTINPPLYEGFSDTDNLLPENADTLFSKKCLKIINVKTDSEDQDAPVKNVYDKNSDTFWHINYHNNRKPYPHYLDFEFDKQGTIADIIVLQRDDGTPNGMVRQIELYVSDDGKSWGSPVAAFVLKAKRTKQILKLDKPVAARFARLKLLTPISKDDPWASLAEVAFRPR